MSAAARAQIFDSIRRGLVRAVLPDAAGSRPTPEGRSSPPSASADALEAFTRALTALTGRVHRAAAVDMVPDLVAAIAHEHGARGFLAWDESHLGVPGLFAALASRGLERVDYDLPFDAASREAHALALAGVGVGLTGADAAIADAGAIVLAHGPGRGRLASLLPPAHIAVLSARQIWPTMPDLLAARPGLLDAGSNLVAIAGPSRTADIEMTLTHGVHGPKYLHVIVVP
ncbi:MAG: lactate utilization protein [Acidobacteria bacterium]|nr:lactate utilization protein [Acidobacteriota bacterium]